MSINGKVPKIPTIAYPSDDCLVYVGREVENGEVVAEGVGYSVHKGETVHIIPMQSVGEITARATLLFQSQDADDGPRSTEVFERLCARVSKRIVSWDWTDMMGNPYEQPYGNPEVVKDLTNDELVWLIQRTTNQETPEERKNV